MGVEQMAGRIKQIHPEYLILFKVGLFYQTYGKDSLILSVICDYYLKYSKSNIPICGFPKNSLNRIKSFLEDKKVNYLVIDTRNNYDIDDKSDNKNLNRYNEELKNAEIVVKQKKKISNIAEELEKFINNKDFNLIIRKVEEVINESRKI